jgi:16S rRNA C967 or C1407 C5-methylase (RsmB/RsmF family)
MLPALCLNPKKGSRVLDMAAAPGGKTTQLAAIMGNTGTILANEEDAIRAQRLEYNVNKQGATCVSVSVGDGRRIVTDEEFDFILLDAPCSGAGTVEVGNSMTYRAISERLVNRSASLQYGLLKKGLSLLKKGGTLVYSTCSILHNENEDVINKILTEFPDVSPVPLSLPNTDTVPTLPSTVKGTMLVAPSQLYEGFFVAKLKKK